MTEALFVACRSILAALMMAFSRSILRMISVTAESSFMAAVLSASPGWCCGG